MLPKKLSNPMTMLSITVTIPNLDLKNSQQYQIPYFYQS